MLPPPKNSGPKLYCLSGHVKRPGVYEEDIGYPLMRMIEEQDRSRIHLCRLLVGAANGLDGGQIVNLILRVLLHHMLVELRVSAE